MQSWFKCLLPLLLITLSVVACAGGDEEVEEEPPTPELAVVVFATEDSDSPKPETTPTPAPPTPSPTPAATVGMGVAAPSATATAVTDFEGYIASRPDNINPLTGLPVSDPALLQRRPVMVRVGNDPGARPQVGLNEADMIYEEIAEWWVTRFTAIFLSQDPPMIAPVRSARLINTQLTSQFQGALASSGGSDGVRWELSQIDITNLDEYFVPQPYFYRENEGWQTRLAFDTTVARDYLAEEGLEEAPKLRGFLFTEQLEEETLTAGVVGDALEVIIPFPKSTSEATWRFDPASGKYVRFTVGENHSDASGNQLNAANVIIYFADHQATDIVEDSNGATSIRIMMDGRGAAWLLRDGKILKGNWETDGSQTPLFVFDDGTPMPLKPGNTWVQVVPLEYFITVDGTEYSSLPGTEPAHNANQATVTPTAPPTLTPIGARPETTPDSQ
jgi:hypothetical protein